MNSRDRFCETMRYGAPDRVPYFEEGIRDDVLRVWRHQGLQRKSEFEVLFRHDRREEIYPDLEPLPRLKQWPSSREDLDRMRRRLNPEDLRRLPRKWPSRAAEPDPPGARGNVACAARALSLHGGGGVEPLY